MFLKKVTQTFCALALVSSFALAKDFIEVKEEFATKNSVIKVFSYRCIHCYNHHRFQTLEKLKQTFPNLSYRIYPVSLMHGTYAKTMNEFFAFALAKDLKNGKDAGDVDSFTNQLAELYFSTHFDNKRDFQSKEDFEKLSLNVLKSTKEELQAFLKTKEASEILAQYALANEVAKTYGTPAFVVNGKYQIKPEAVTSLEALQNLVKELSSK